MPKFLRVSLILAVLTALWLSQPADQRSPVRLQSSVPLQRIAEVPNPNFGTPLRIIRALKLPEPESWLADGSYLINDNEEFRARLGSKNARYVKWNNVDFKSQSVVIFSRRYSCLCIPVKLHSISKTDKDIVLRVEESVLPKDSALPAALDFKTIGVLVSKISGPLRTEYRVVQEP